MNFPSHTVLMRLMLPYARSSTVRGLTLFFLDIAGYITCIVGVLFLPSIWLQILASVTAGVFAANLLVLAHDAAHGSLVRGRKLNFILAVASLTPAIFSYRMWVYNHHVMHHGRTNGDHKDSYTPFSKSEYDALPGWRQRLERFYRNANPISFGVYYIVERWSQSKIYPNASMPRETQISAWKHLAYLAIYYTCFAALLICAPKYSSTGGITAIALGVFLPFFVFNCIFGFIIWSMHTHPDIGWYHEEDIDPALARSSELFTVVLTFPRWFSAWAHHVSDHAAHHLCPAIPCYHLNTAQSKLTAAMGEHAIVAKGSLRYVADTMRRCKLYDYDNHRWLDFDGNATTDITKPFRHIIEDIPQKMAA